MRKLVLCAAVVLAFTATALPTTCWDLGLPSATEVNFEGHGVFAQVPVPTLDVHGDPNPLADGTELFGIAKINDIVKVSNGDTLWTPAAGTEMTLSFWNAFVSAGGSTRTDVGNLVLITSNFDDGAKLVLCQDDTADYNTTFGSAAFHVDDGEYPTVYTGQGYVAQDPGEMVFLALGLDDGTSTLIWNKTTHQFVSASFDSLNVHILGGCGADQFTNVLQGHGDVLRLNLNWNPALNWLYDSNANVVATTVPAPTALISLFSGLALLGGYRLRRRS